ncbi:MAG TPA: DUF3455 domain-containing protein [Polyangiaceae bacterium]|jgi:hypothetical protein|nr:DUF3455 domain-containing protein [Polyangiaceae bacterium]
MYLSRAFSYRATIAAALSAVIGFAVAPARAQNAAATAQPAAKPASAPVASKRKHLRACPPHIPEELNPPADATLELVLPASGVQSYACGVDKPGEAPDWQPKGPHANLGEGNNIVGVHFGGPTWQLLDGSSVKGTKIASASSPDKSATVWLLMSGAATGEGGLGKITYIQRLETVGGKAPATGCDASHLDAKVLVPYRAYYYFYRLSEPGEKVVQCRGTEKKAALVKKGDKAAAAEKKPTEKKPAEKK